MNNKDRKEIDRAIIMIQEGAQILADIGDSELEKFENLPDNLQLSERGQKFEEDSENLTNAQSEIESAISELEYATC